MKRQKKNQAGITLISLVISIIVMLILAGVSLNATVGENGIITRAQEAAVQTKISQQKEAIEHALTNINIDTLTEDVMPEIDQIAKKLVSYGVIDDYQRAKDSDGNITENVAVIIDSATKNRCFFGLKEDNKFKISRDAEGVVSAELVTEISGGNVEGLALVTKESFGEEDSTGSDPNKGKFEITSNAEVMFLDPISGKLSIYVPSGVHAKVSIYAKMELTNAGIKRSAIDIAKGGILDLYIDDGVEVIVNSGLGEDAQGNVPGKGGYAGISVPWEDTNGDNILNNGDSYAVLNLKGNGTLKSIGGDAGDGSTASYGAGGGGAGAGIGGNGGQGAYGANGYGHDSINPNTANPCADNGGAGVNCGVVNIEDGLKVFAYGGAGGSGGYGGNGSGTGGGGYPGAGIGGGGAGGAGATCCTGAGGYSAGTGPYSYMTPINGGAGEHFNQNRVWTDNPDYGMWGAGGGYYVGMDVTDSSGDSLIKKALGGFGGTSWRIPHRGGNGGIGGMGGKIVKSSDSKIYAFNGNKYSDGSSSNKELDQAAIYLQAGISIKKWKVTSLSSYESTTTVITPTLVEDSTYVCNTSTINYINEWYNGKSNTEKIISFNDTLKNIDMSTQGIGSGAGYIELSNGTLN